MKRRILFAICAVSLFIIEGKGKSVDSERESQSIEKPGIVIQVSTNFLRAFIDENPRDQLYDLKKTYSEELERIHGQLYFYYDDEPIILQVSIYNEGNVAVRRPSGGWFGGIRILVESVDARKEVLRIDVSNNTPGPSKGARKTAQGDLLMPGEGVTTVEQYSLRTTAANKLAPGLLRVTIDADHYHVETETFHPVGLRMQSPHLWIIEPRTTREKAIALCHHGYRAWLAEPNESGLEKAEPLLLKAIQVDKSIICAKSYLASMYRKTGRYDMALPLLEELVCNLKDDMHKMILEEVRRKIQEKKNQR